MLVREERLKFPERKLLEILRQSSCRKYACFLQLCVCAGWVEISAGIKWYPFNTCIGLKASIWILYQRMILKMPCQWVEGGKLFNYFWCNAWWGFFGKSESKVDLEGHGWALKIRVEPIRLPCIGRQSLMNWINRKKVFSLLAPKVCFIK